MNDNDLSTRINPEFYRKFVTKENSGPAHKTYERLIIPEMMVSICPGYGKPKL